MSKTDGTIMAQDGGVPSGGKREKAMKFMSFALAGLFVVTLAAPARADDVSKYFPPKKQAEMVAKYNANYNGCLDTLRELGYDSMELYGGCSWRHNHMRFTNRRATAKDPVSYRP
jgi:hypothetical protein